MCALHDDREQHQVSPPSCIAMSLKTVGEPIFPLEIYPFIIKELGDDMKALSQCSLVSRWFRNICQAELFDSVRLRLRPLSDPQGIARYHAFLDLIAQNHSLAENVHQLGLNLGKMKEEDTMSLPVLPCLRTFSLNTRPTRLSGLIKGEVKKIMHLSTLEDIRLSGQVALSLLQACTSNLKRLVLVDRKPFDLDEEIPEPNLDPALLVPAKWLLASLTVGHPSQIQDLLSHPCIPFSLSGLQSFSTKIFRGDFMELGISQTQLIVTISSASLKVLKLGIPDDPCHRTLDLGPLSNLSSLSFVSAVAAMGISGLPIMLQNLCNIIETLPRDDVDVDIDLTIIVGSDDMPREQVDADVPWGDIDRVLQSQKKCHVKVTSMILGRTLSTDEVEGPDVAEAPKEPAGILTSLLPNTFSAGRITVASSMLKGRSRMVHVP